MRIYIILFFSALMVLTACTSDDRPRPADVLPPEKLTPLLVELHIADGHMFNSNQAPDTLYKYHMGNFVQILKKYGTDTTGFKKTFTWYTRNPDKLDPIYDDVTKLLQAKNDSLNKVKPAPVKPPVTLTK